MEPLLTCANDTTFLLRALLEGERRDGRGLQELRRLGLVCDRSDGRASAEVCLGSTRVHAAVTASIEPPFVDRPLEGFLVFNVELLPMSAPWAEAPAGGARAPPAAVHIARILERQVRDARAIDSEALCIVPGEAVWSLRVDVRVLEDGGNATDASALATMAALLHFRRPDVTVRGTSVTVHDYGERVGLPLAVHHIPVTITLSLFSPAAFAPLASAVAVGSVAPPVSGGGAPSAGCQLPPMPKAPILIFDPTLLEAAAADGTLTFCLNAHGELCGVHKLGGCPISAQALIDATGAASKEAVRLVAALKDALAVAEKAAGAKALVAHAAASSWRGGANEEETAAALARVAGSSTGLGHILVA